MNLPSLSLLLQNTQAALTADFVRLHNFVMPPRNNQQLALTCVPFVTKGKAW